MPMIPVHSDSDEVIGVLVIDQEHHDVLVSKLSQKSDNITHTDPLHLFPIVIDGKITKLEAIKSDPDDKPAEHAN